MYPVPASCPRIPPRSSAPPPQGCARASRRSCGRSWALRRMSPYGDTYAGSHPPVNGGDRSPAPAAPPDRFDPPLRGARRQSIQGPRQPLADRFATPRGIENKTEDGAQAVENPQTGTRMRFRRSGARDRSPAIASPANPRRARVLARRAESVQPRGDRESSPRPRVLPLSASRKRRRSRCFLGLRNSRRRSHRYATCRPRPSSKR